MSLLNGTTEVVGDWPREDLVVTGSSLYLVFGAVADHVGNAEGFVISGVRLGELVPGQWRVTVVAKPIPAQVKPCRSCGCTPYHADSCPEQPSLVGMLDRRYWRS